MMSSRTIPMTRASHGRHNQEMNLPDGSSCADCRHFTRCAALFGHIAEDEVCDWSPSRFSPMKPAAISAALAADSIAGLDWWNALSEGDRKFWMLASQSSSTADAWHYFKRCEAACITWSTTQTFGGAT